MSVQEGNVGVAGEITLPAVVDNLYRVLNFVGDMLRPYPFTENDAIQISVAVEEIFVNIAMYAYAPVAGEVTVICTVNPEPLSVTMTFIDGGRPFNPLMNEAPNTLLPLEARPVGGLGMHIVKKYMDSVSYTCKDSRNILTIRKQVGA